MNYIVIKFDHCMSFVKHISVNKDIAIDNR